MNSCISKYLLCLLGLTWSVISVCSAQRVMKDVSKTTDVISYDLDAAPLFKQTLESYQEEVDKEIELGVVVPVPKDMAGGYSHERHKKNLFVIQKAGDLYQFTGDKKYAKYIKDHFMAYAKMTPFLLFAKAIDEKMPEQEIFDYRDGILEKAVYSLLYETDAKGQFFPMNDAQKGMSWLSREVVSAVDIGYAKFGNDPMLLHINYK